MGAPDWIKVVIVVGLPIALIGAVYMKERLDKARERRRLLYSVLDGVPLPSITDPRWERVNGEFRLGHWRVDQGQIFLADERIGYWHSYHAALRERFEDLDRERLAMKAIEALTEDVP